jgi:hypothetical protein
MHRFTEKDILIIKQQTQTLVELICGGSSILDKYVEDKTFTTQQVVDMKDYIVKHYPNINYCPLPKALQPLIDIAQRQVKEHAAARAAKSKKPVRWSDGYSNYTTNGWGEDTWLDGYASYQ